MLLGSFNWLEVWVCNDKKVESSNSRSSGDVVVVVIDHNLEGVSVHWWVDVDDSLGVDSVSKTGAGVVPFTVVVRLPGLTVVVGVLELHSVDRSLSVFGVSSWLNYHAVSFIEVITLKVNGPPLRMIVLSMTVPKTGLRVQSCVGPFFVPSMVSCDSGLKIKDGSLCLWLEVFWLEIWGLESPKIKSSCGNLISMVFITENSESISVHWWVNSDFD